MVISTRAQITEQNDSYRRGLVLGLTMAEIAILIIFILLLALAVLLAIENEKRHKVEEELLVTEKKVTELIQRVSVLRDLAGRDNIEEFVRELIAAREALKQIGDVKSRLVEAKKLIAKYGEAAREAGVEATPDKIGKALQEAREIIKTFAKIGDKSGEEIMKALEEAEEIKKSLAELEGKSGKEILQELKALRTESKRLGGQLANAQKKLAGLGKGNEMPSCWAKPDGSVEYIYEVAVTSSGMNVRETYLPHRENDRGLLPISTVLQEQEVSSATFNSMMKPLFQWSIEKKCRFYVKIYDETGSTEKDLYKKRLKNVEGRFYKDFRIYKGY